MQLHNLQAKTIRHDRKRVGRGGKRGTYSGRGNKGQKARSGVSIDPLFEGGRSSLVDRLKKVRGFKSVSAKKNNINLNDLEKNFKDGEIVNLESLVKTGLIGKIRSKDGVKILSDGKITKKIKIEKNILISKKAKEFIEKAGGAILK